MRNGLRGAKLKCLKKKSIVCETQSDGSQVSICQYGIERDSGGVSQKKGYSHTLENLHQ